MIDLAQADSTLRQQDKPCRFYYVERSDGQLCGSFDSQADAIRYALKHDDAKVVTKYQDETTAMWSQRDALTDESIV